jgi:A/G-specific adenine glycosylase
MPVTSSKQIAHKILRWFDENARDLPWRNPPGAALPLGDADWPYRVWLSEIMLQQTTVATVKPYFAKFTTLWPSVVALAAARDADVMSAWAGLGYYARARNLLACARAVASMGGRLPDDEEALRALPGIGAYTAAAIAAFAFGKRAVIVDGNIERVTARLFALETPLPKAKPAIALRMEEMTPTVRAGDFAQGLMDLAATLCTPRAPRCLLCPVADVCLGRERATDFPVKAPKTAKPERHGTVWWIEQDGKVLLVRRPAKGLLGGMRALPGEDWIKQPVTPALRLPASQALRINTQSVAGVTGGSAHHPLGSITHIFTHFRLTLDVVAVDAESGCASQLDGEWWPVDRIDDAGLPTVFAKAATRALAREDKA